jgi:hypothetical protein
MVGPKKLVQDHALLALAGVAVYTAEKEV